MEANIPLYVCLSIPLFYFVASMTIGSTTRKLRHITTVGGSSLPLLSYFGAIRFLFHAEEIMQEGYEKYKGGMFKFAELGHWRVVVTGHNLIDELRKAPEDVLSSPEAKREALELDYTLGLELMHDPYHIHVIRSRLRRDLDSIFLNVHDEIVAAFDEEISLDDEGKWTAVPAMKMLADIVCRASNRLFVGLPTCRNEDFCALNKSFTLDVVICATVFRICPSFFKPFAARFLPKVSRDIDRAAAHLGPMISERLQLLDDLGDTWVDRPNDLLQSLIEAARGKERSVRAIAIRVLAVNLAALHTSTVTLTMVFYYLAAYPQYAAVLRDEIESTVKEHGWTKTGLDAMSKLDSFVREVMRVSGIFTGGLSRIAMKDYVFSNGTFIPAGTRVVAPTGAIYADDSVYPNAKEFFPWRFYDLRNQAGENVQVVSTSTNFLSFGHGRYACPGRFFASMEMKTILAHVVVNYDVKMEKEGVIPPSTRIGHSCVPNTKAKVLLRKRFPEASESNGLH